MQSRAVAPGVVWMYVFSQSSYVWLIAGLMRFLLPCLRTGAKEETGRSLVVDHVLEEHGIWTREGSAGGGVGDRLYFEGILTSLTDGLDVGYERSQGDLLVFGPEQLGGDYWSISEWHKEGTQDFGFSQQSVKCLFSEGVDVPVRSCSLESGI